MKLRQTMIGYAIAGILASSAALAQKVEVRLNDPARLASYRTYSWDTVTTGSALFAGPIKEAIDKELDSRGWKRVGAGAEVALQAESKMNAKKNTYVDWNSPENFGNEQYTESTVWTDTITLRVSMLDRATGEAIWDATAVWRTATVGHHPWKQQNDKKVDKVANDMFHRFPGTTAHAVSLRH